MAVESAKVMFEIYRDSSRSRAYRAVYYTELDEHDKETEIARAMAGEHVYDSFLADAVLDEGKRKVDELVTRLNEGETIAEAEIAAFLAPFAG